MVALPRSEHISEGRIYPEDTRAPCRVLDDPVTNEGDQVSDQHEIPPPSDGKVSQRARIRQFHPSGVHALVWL